MSKTNETWARLIGQDGNIIVPKVFADLMGGLDGGAVLADLAWWQASHGDWFWRTDSLIAERQHVSPYAVRHARGKLTAAGLLEQRMQGQPAKAHYRLNLDAVLALAGDKDINPLGSRPIEIVGAGPTESNGSRPRDLDGALLLKREVKGTVKTPVGADANDASAEVALLAPADLPAGGPTPKPAKKPRAPKAPDPLTVLAENIMLDTTGRMSVPDKRHAGLVWPLVNDIRGLVGNNPLAAVQAWLAFCDAMRDSKQWQYVQPHNARDRFGVWAANGGAAAIEQAKVMFAGVPAGGDSEAV